MLLMVTFAVTIKTAMILAAGRGERMRPLTDEVPKPLLEIKGRPLIEYHIKALEKSGFSRIIINYAWLGQQIVDYLGDGHRFGVQIIYSPESTALETAGGIINALPLLCPDGDNRTFAVVNADIFCDYDYARLPTHLGNDLAHLVLVNNPPHNPAGDFAIESNRLGQQSAPRFTFSGIGLYHRDLFTGRQPGSLRLAVVLRDAITRQLVRGEVYAGPWTDIGTPERLAQLNIME
ncbi:MAG: MurNAc alpha-1-phosphate uridylyltransferase [Paraglaciecola sp.]|jgi:MurNAc alpha-1-phosphate uridylyltransferase